MRCFILLVLAISFVPSLALARVWTNREGKEIDAEFVDATEEKVTLKKPDGKVVTFSLDLLCEDDQRVIRGILIRRAASGKAPSADEPGSPFETLPNEKPAASKASDDNDSDDAEDDDGPGGIGTMRNVKEDSKNKKKKLKIENREWTDSFGNSTSGKFIRFAGNKVVVLRSGRQAMLDYWQLSDSDQEYLRELCESAGQPHLIPKHNPANQNNAPNTGIAGNAPPAAGFPMPGGSAVAGGGINIPGPPPGFAGGVNIPVPGGAAGGPRFGNPEDLARRMRELEDRAKAASTHTPPPSSVASAPSYPMPGMSSAGPTPGMSSPGPTPGTSYTPPAMTSSMPSSAMPSSAMPGSSMPSSSMPSPSMPRMASAPMPSMPSMPSHSFMVKECMSCGKELPSTVTAGDRCPGCGVYFSFDETNGKTASGGGWGGGGGGSGSSRGMFRGIAVLVVIAIKAVAFMAWRAQR